MKILAAVAALAVGSVASADMVAYWTFPDVVPPGADNFKITWPLNATFSASGIASASTDGLVWDGTPTPAATGQGLFQYFTGTAINLQSGYVAGSRLAMRSLSGAAEGKSITWRFDTSNYKDIVMTFAERATGTGATTISISTSTDGVNFAAAPSLTITSPRDSNFALRTVNLSAMDNLEFQTAVYVKMTFTGFGSSSSTGNTALDNVLVSGTFVPTPGTLAVLGLAGLVARRRRN